MNILFYIGNSPFPFGSAGAARIRVLARGLVDAGVKVKVLSLAVLENRQEDFKNAERCFHGIHYESIAGYGPSRRYTSYIDKLFLYSRILTSSVCGYYRIKKLVTDEKYDAIIFYSWNSLEIEPVIRLANSLGITTVCDVVEWPTVKSFRGGYINPLYWSTARTWNFSHYLSDGIVAISSFIEQQYIQKGLPTIRIPAMIDTKRSNNYFHHTIEKKTPNHIRLAYLGTMASKDDPETMLASIKLAIQRGGTIHLDIIGTDGNAGPAAKYKILCATDPLLSSSVTFHGWISNEYFPSYFWNVNAVVLLRQKNIETVASFPTRLPELLLYGSPLITSAVGDISEYLQDGVNAIIIPAGDVNNLADRILELPKKQEFMGKLGEAGRMASLTYFSNDMYAMKLINFLERFSKSV